MGLYCVSRIIAFRKAEKEEENRARLKIRQKLEEDKVLYYFFPFPSFYITNSYIFIILNLMWEVLLVLVQAERRRKLGLPPEEPKPVVAAPPPQEEKKVSTFCNSLLTGES